MISCRGFQDGANCINNLTLLSVMEKCDVTEDSIDIVLHYKVNPYVNRPTDGLTCWLRGGGSDGREGGTRELGQKPDNRRGKKKKKVKKCFML